MEVEVNLGIAYCRGERREKVVEWVAPPGHEPTKHNSNDHRTLSIQLHQFSKSILIIK